MTKFIALTFALLAASPALAYTQDDATACTGDALRLCSQHIPSESRIDQCLNENKSRLSKACHAVISRPAPAKQSRLTN